MRKQLLLLPLLLLFTAALVTGHESATAVAQPPIPHAIPLDHWPTELLADNWTSVQLEAVNQSQAIVSLASASDNCGGGLISVPVNGQTGGLTNVSQFTTAVGDPNLRSCMWASPASDQGYRSAWYIFTAAATGTLIVNAEGSNYDTVVAIHSGSCANLSLLSCNDDHYGLTSRATAAVVEGQTYYIQVVDWRLDAPSGGVFLNLTAGIISQPKWQPISAAPVARTRHMAVAVGPYLYVLGGQAFTSGGESIRIRDMSRFDTRTQTWETMPSMPHVCGGQGPDSGGYANTTAVHINGRIYVPAGTVGDSPTYSGRHCMFDTTTNLWYPNQPNVPLDAPWPNNNPYAWSAAVAFPDFNGYFLTGGVNGATPQAPNPNGLFPGWQPRNQMMFYQIGGTVDDPGVWNVLASMQSPRFGHTAAHQRIGANDFICVVGGVGQDGDGNPVLITGGECYNVNANNWNRTVAPLNIPRYYAGSAVGPDGRWYIFGGIDANRNPVALTEVYDAASDSWIALDSRYDLGGTAESPTARAWPRGDFIDGNLWVTGGEIPSAISPDAVNLTERLLMAPKLVYLPAINQGLGSRPGRTMAAARPIASGEPQMHSFNASTDYIHIFYYDTAVAGVSAIQLTNIPTGSDYNIHIYHNNKGRIVSGENVGSQNESVVVSGSASRYYIFVERVFPPPGADPDPQPYRLEVTHP
jgi:hypothetical protein